MYNEIYLCSKHGILPALKWCMYVMVVSRISKVAGIDVFDALIAICARIVIRKEKQ